MNLKSSSSAFLPYRGRHLKPVLSSVAEELRRLAWIIADAYSFNKAYYRRLIVRAIEDGLVLILMGAAIWSLCYVLGGIFDALGVGA